MEKIIGACGLVCNECGAYTATQANDSAAIANVAAEWSKLYGGDVKPEYVWCDGCLSPGERKCGHCSDCHIRLCVIDRGLANCAYCDDYNCEKLARYFAMEPKMKEELDAIRSSLGK